MMQKKDELRGLRILNFDLLPALCLIFFIFVYEPESYGLSASDRKSRAFIKNTDFTKRP